MSLAQKSFVTAAVAPFLLAFGLAASDANADVAYGCRKPEAVPALKEKVLNEEHMIPVAARFTALSETTFIQETIMMNPNTKTGLLWQKDTNDGTVCIIRKYSDMQLFNNQAFDEKAYLQVAGKNENAVEINQAITNAALNSSSLNPMFRATAIVPTNVAFNQPTMYVEYMLGNVKTQKGAVLAATFDGHRLRSFTKHIPNPSEAPVKFGAVYTPVGEDLLKGGKIADAGAANTTLNSLTPRQ